LLVEVATGVWFCAGKADGTPAAGLVAGLILGLDRDLGGLGGSTGMTACDPVLGGGGPLRSPSGAIVGSGGGPGAAATGPEGALVPSVGTSNRSSTPPNTSRAGIPYIVCGLGPSAKGGTLGGSSARPARSDTDCSRACSAAFEFEGSCSSLVTGCGRL